MQIKQSPNYQLGPTVKEFIVLHQTLGLMPGCLEWLMNPVSQVSAHFLITKKGEVYNLVKTEDIAWHAGVIDNPSERGKEHLKKNLLGAYINPNKYAIGIEFESKEGEDFTEKQYLAGLELVSSLGLPIVEHRDLTSYKKDLTVGVFDTFFARLNPVESKKDIKNKIIELLNKL